MKTTQTNSKRHLYHSIIVGMSDKKPAPHVSSTLKRQIPVGIKRVRGASS